jgi:hypothetical protein
MGFDHILAAPSSAVHQWMDALFAASVPSNLNWMFREMATLIMGTIMAASAVVVPHAQAFPSVTKQAKKELA